ncbi:MAG: LPS export ABC transporter permease LptF [Gammaproteobacteria bacterium]|nr:LPS export ABC transporter permease LptF [Gammaproteobacteria bacterium]
MGLIFRYLAKETYITMFAVTGILVLIFMSHQFVHYLSDAALGRLTPQAVLQMMCIQIPLLLGFMIPLGFFIGILLTYGRLYVDNEITIFNACGISKFELLLKSLSFSTIVILAVATLMLWVEPKMAWYRDRIIANAVASSPIEKVSPGRFQQVGNWILYTEGVTRDHQQMANVFAAAVPARKKNGDKMPSLDVVVAEKAYQKISPLKETYIVLANGNRYLGVPGKNDYQMVQFKEYGVRLPDKIPEMRRLEEFMSFTELWHRRNQPGGAAEFQWRIAMPISVLILTLFAVPLSEVKPRQGRFAQILPAIIIYIIYIDLLFLGRAWIEKSRISPQLGLWWIHALMLGLATVIIIKKIKPSSHPSSSKAVAKAPRKDS